MVLTKEYTTSPPTFKHLTPYERGKICALLVFCKRKFPIFAKVFPQAPVGNFYVNLIAS
ncbi:hypothetical protein LZ11_01119 [Thermosediminibacter litoriperuensis]|uniref:Uncharacterized protein n=1 Tax=Thermosediminibacter litoriperuensis TaxID=291989 RepID=A0A5S5AUS5_9FIRM|nr:hypothetical protein LZ11_01119 [Thermosediminibacter litoriperuensis]